jgi:hypothetical protein
MAFQIVVTDTLTDAMVQVGGEMIQSLEAAGFPVRAAFWWYLPQSEVWRLMIATPVVSQLGATEAYRRIHGIVDRIPSDGAKIRMNDVSVIEDNSHLVSLLRNAVKPSRKASGIRLFQNVINGVMIDDAYIYRL